MRGASLINSMTPKSELSKKLAIAVQALEEALTRNLPAAAHLAKQELQSISDAIDALAEPQPETDS